MVTAVSASRRQNIALADGLLLAERNYIGLMEVPISIFSGIKSGAPEYLDKENDIEYFFYVVEQMKESLPQWDAPPLIVEHNDGIFRVNDGRHRLELYRQLGVKKVWAVLWKNK